MGRESGCRVCWVDEWPESHPGCHGHHCCDMFLEAWTEAEETSLTLLGQEWSKAYKKGELGTCNSA
jgi:hypothetical protein